MDIRPFDLKEDIRAVERIWYECGWVENETQAAFVKDFLGTGSCIVGCLDGTPECQVHTVPGTIHHLKTPLKLCAVTAVTTSRIARKQGFARVMTAQQLAAGAENGAEVAALGMFDQGFYDQVGFGTGAYEHMIRFDPTTLLVDSPFRVPSRLTAENWADVHGAMVDRLKHHGAVVLDPPILMKGELGWHENGFGLGYYEGKKLSHFFWAEAKDEHGPYEISFMAYRSLEELMELLALIKSLGDQVSSFVMQEPAHLQLQTLLKQPFRNRRNTFRSTFENIHRSAAWWQVRLLDVAACLDKFSWPGEAFEFNLNLTDPAADFLSGDGWQGVGGEYVVRIGERSGAQPGARTGLPTLTASINTFSRLYFGIASATEQLVAPDFSAPDELVRQLDAAFCLPRMSTSWDF
jgi:predicted acetyltransferase